MMLHNCCKRGDKQKRKHAFSLLKPLELKVGIEDEDEVFNVLILFFTRNDERFMKSMRVIFDSFSHCVLMLQMFLQKTNT